MAVAVGGAALYAWTEWRATGGVLGFPLDDSWIHLQFARNLAAGEGLAFDAGRWVGGSTGPLWTGLLSGAFLLPGSAFAWAKVMGVLCLLGTLGGLWSLGREYGLGHGATALAALLLVMTDWLVWSALSGMEISLFLLLLTWGLVLHQRERSASRGVVSVLLFASSALVRPEGLLLVVLALVDRVVHFERGERGLGVDLRWGRELWIGGSVAVLTLAPAAAFNRFAHGSVFPTTLAVKTDAAHRLWPAARDLWTAAEILFRPQPWALAGAALGAAILLERLGTREERSLLPLWWLVALPCAYSAMAEPGGRMYVGNFGRYLFPLFPPLILLGCLGLERLGSRIGTMVIAKRPLRIAWVLALVVILPTAGTLWTGASRYALNVRNVADSDVAVGRWITENLPPGARIAVQDIGAIGYWSPNPLLDLVGIVNPEILPWVKGDRVGSHPTGLGGLFEFVERAGADYLVLFPESYGGWRALEQVEPDLGVLQRLEVPQNITMAGSELAVLVPPWSRFARLGTDPPDR